MILASEDIGNADPKAMQVALAAWDCFHRVGPAEGERALAQASVQAAVGALSDHEPTLMLPMRRLAATGTGDFATQLAGWLASEDERRGLRPLGERWGPWHLVGPFSGSGFGREGRLLGKAQRIEKTFAEHTAGSAGPDLTETYKGKGWSSTLHPMELERDGRDLDVEEVRLTEVLGRRLDDKARARNWAAGAVAYLYRRVELDEPRTYTVDVSGDGGVGVWLDGVLLGEAYEDAAMAHRSVELTLEPGVHHLWVKVVHEVGNWRFRMGGGEGIDQDLVDAAIDRAADYLVQRQHLDGSWTGHDNYGAGYTAMALYALAKSGYEADHPVIRRGLAYLDAHPTKKTYSLSAEVLARATADREADADWYQGAVDRLAAWQGTTGMWAYPSGHEDLSNTLFVALALRAAEKRGAVVAEETWRELIEGTFECWGRDKSSGNPPLGFSYLPRQDVTGSMTVAGLSCLLLAADALGGRGGRDLGRKDGKRIEEALERGLAWIDRNMVWDKNPGKNNWHYFWVYGLERLGALLDTPTLGGVLWYPAGAEYLIATQHEDGHWHGGHTEIDTVLGLLFLNRATAPTSGGETAGEWRLVLSDTPAEPGRPTVRARLAAVVGERLELWVEDLGGLAPTTVEAVEWVARPAAGGDELVLARVDAAEDKGLGRFATRIEEPPVQACQLVARVVHAGGTHESVPLDLPALYTEVELQGALDQRSNLLRGAKAGASSARGGSTPRDAIDGKQGTNWILEPSDRDPRWWAELASPVRAGRLVLIHRGPSPQHADLSRVTHVRVDLSGKRTLEVELDPDPMRATVVELERDIMISRLELEPLGFTGDAASGFSEVLLLP